MTDEIVFSNDKISELLLHTLKKLNMTVTTLEANTSDQGKWFIIEQTSEQFEEINKRLNPENPNNTHVQICLNTVQEQIDDPDVTDPNDARHALFEAISSSDHSFEIIDLETNILSAALTAGKTQNVSAFEHVIEPLNPEKTILDLKDKGPEFYEPKQKTDNSTETNVPEPKTSGIGAIKEKTSKTPVIQKITGLFKGRTK
jgi:hypothetical protein